MRNLITGRFDQKYHVSHKVGKLLLLRDTKRRSHGYTIWECKCDCSKIIKLSSNKITKYNIASCGCASVYGRKRTFECPIKNSLFHNYKRAAASRGIKFNINRHFFFDIIIKPCFFCGLAAYQSYKNSSNPKKILIRTGIDRLDNTKGYEPKNCVPCCKICNTAKSTQKLNDFKIWIQRVHAHFAAK